MAWLPSQEIPTVPGGGWGKVNVQILPAPLTPVAGLPLTSRSSAAGPVTVALKVTVTWDRVLTVPAGGLTDWTVGAAFSLATPRQARSANVRKKCFRNFTAGSDTYNAFAEFVEYKLLARKSFWTCPAWRLRS